MFRNSARTLVATLLFFGLVTATISADDKPAKAKKRLTAVDMMRQAHDKRAEWKEFAGFKADIVVMDNESRVEGSISVAADGEVTLQLSNSDTEKWVRTDLESLVSHRLPGGERKYDVSFVKGERPTALGRLIRFNDDRMHSVYRIRHNLITEVQRTMGNRKLLINVVDFQWNKEKKVLPRNYTVSWTDGKTGKVTSSHIVNNRWVRVGKIDLPMRLFTIINKEDGSRDVREIRLSNHKLAKAAKAAK